MLSDQTLATNGQPAFAEIGREMRLSDKVVAVLSESILSGELVIGSKLPAERTLCEQFGVSRPVVREALRSLLAKGLLTEHPRRGHVVAQPQPEDASASLTMFLRGRHLDYGQIAEIRGILEVETAARAAERASAAQIEAVRLGAEALVDGMSAEAAALADVEFHRLIAVATGNEFFVVLIDSLREVLLQIQKPTLADPKIIKTARTAHRRIAKAIAARDADAARAAMTAHLALAERQARKLMA